MFIVNIKEQIKVQERAKPFASKQDEINNFSDEHLQLYASLNITEKNTTNLRFRRDSHERHG